LSFALFRTYAVPSIGGLLFRTGEFTRHGRQLRSIRSYPGGYRIDELGTFPQRGAGSVLADGPEVANPGG
jgi:hypothetical protein